MTEIFIYAFWCLALMGTAFFVVGYLLMFTGLGIGEHCLETGDGDFTAFSIHTLSGLGMIIGWTGLGALKQWELSIGQALGAAFFCGIFALYCFKGIHAVAKKMISTGTVFNIADSVGKVGTTYQHIPADGTGKITLCLNGFTCEIEAASALHEDIPSFTAIRVLQVIGKNTVSVCRL